MSDGITHVVDVYKRQALSFNLHVGADADMTNKITVNIDSMNSAGLGVKGIKADTEQDATYAVSYTHLDVYKRQGKLVGKLGKDQMNQEEIMKYAAGGVE